MLNAQGRVLFDALAYQIGEKEVLLDVNEGLSDALLGHLKQFDLRREIEVTERKDLSLYVAGDSETKLDNALVDCIDPRTPLLGRRLVGQRKEELMPSDCSLYAMQRVLTAGVPEAPMDIYSGEAFPFECSGDCFGAVERQRGCYLGQELTARAIRLGLSRKRLVPWRSSGIAATQHQVGDQLLSSDRQATVGRIQSVYNEGRFGFALVRAAFVAEGSEAFLLDGSRVQLHRATEQLDVTD